MTRKLSIPDLPTELRALLQQIPAGCVTTYGDLATALGDVGAARWVGEYLLHHDDHDEHCVCHRVIRRTGEVGLYITRDSDEKIARLVGEGIAVTEGRVDFQQFGLADFHSRRPLAALAERQRELPQQFCAEACPALPAHVAAVDVSYAGNQAVAALVFVETQTGKLINSFTMRQPVQFPYIPGYLSFRELPALLSVIRSVPKTIEIPEVVFVDGNGILHHRGAGIATHFGIETGWRTIGIGKKLLCGSVDLEGLQPGESRPVVFEDRVVGAAIKAGPHSRPIFVSPGQRMIVADAVRLTQRLFHGHRLPEPIFLADRLSREAAKTTSTD